MATKLEHQEANEERVDRAVAALHGRATRLRAESRNLHPLVASAYRRRAAELELGAWALSVRNGRPADEFLHHAAPTPVAA